MEGTQLRSQDHLSYKLPVLVKGVICHQKKYLLRKNEREE